MAFRTRQPAEDEIDASIGEAELLKLQNQYRILEGVRKQESEDSQNEIRKQTSMISKLKQENETLTREVEYGEGAVLERTSKSDQLLQARTRLNELDGDIQAARSEADSIDEIIKQKRKVLLEKRKGIVVARKAADPETIRKQVKTNENRLEKTIKKYNEQLTVNASMRQIIDHLKIERESFENVYSKLDKELTDIKKNMADVIEKSNQAYEARNEAQSKITALKEKNEKEIAQYNTELKELTRVLEHDRKLRTFMGIKGQDRAKELERTGRLSLTSRKQNITSEKDKKPEETVKSYEEAFAKISEATGIQDMDKLVDRFIEVEDQNFSLFNFVNELSNEIESLQEKIAESKKDIENFNRQGETMDIQRKNLMKDLEDKLLTTEQQATALQEKQQSATSTIEQLKIGIESLFTKIKCDKNEIAQQLGNATINDANIMQYLGIVEQRANELLQLQTLLDIQATQKWEQLETELREKVDDGEPVDLATTLGPKPKATGLLGVGPQPTTHSPTIQPPSTEYDYDSDDQGEDEAKPLSQAELRAKILQNTSKKEQSTIKSKSLKHHESRQRTITK